MRSDKMPHKVRFWISMEEEEGRERRRRVDRSDSVDGDGRRGLCLNREGSKRGGEEGAGNSHFDGR